uniref:Spo11/DNA topoisomerase VI subunit A N-terminal domain-containing protein n=1 Tax=Timema bartmani TaxID=61472 RepID=A0A7R9F1V9_9NEOP|nr:unnamed protein product [Timema bartmani]
MLETCLRERDDCKKNLYKNLEEIKDQLRQEMKYVIQNIKLKSPEELNTRRSQLILSVEEVISQVFESTATGKPPNLFIRKQSVWDHSTFVGTLFFSFFCCFLETDDEDKFEEGEEEENSIYQELESLEEMDIPEEAVEDPGPSESKMMKVSFARGVKEILNMKLSIFVTMRPSQQAKMTTVRFGDPKSRRKFALIVRLLSDIHKLLLTDTTSTRRELYYQDVKLAKSQIAVDAAMRDVCCLLDACPWELGVVPTSKGLVAGPLVIVTADNERLDCSAHSEGFGMFVQLVAVTHHLLWLSAVFKSV